MRKFLTGLIGLGLLEHSVLSLAGNVRASAFARIRSLHNPTQASLELGIDGEAIEHGVLGFSVLQAHSFYGLPWGWRRGP